MNTTGKSFAIPQGRALLAFFIIYGFFSGTSYVALVNIISNASEHNWMTIICSVLWLLFVLVVIYAELETCGKNTIVQRQLSMFSNRHYIWITEKDGESFIEIGFLLWNSKFVLTSINIDSLLSVEWSTGQASCLSGRDADDWSVVLWYKDENSKRYGSSLDEWSKESPMTIGPERAKNITESFGMELIEFLRENGLKINKTEDDTVYSVG